MSPIVKISEDIAKCKKTQKSLLSIGVGCVMSALIFKGLNVQGLTPVTIPLAGVLGSLGASMPLFGQQSALAAGCGDIKKQDLPVRALQSVLYRNHKAFTRIRTMGLLGLLGNTAAMGSVMVGKATITHAIYSQMGLMAVVLPSMAYFFGYMRGNRKVLNTFSSKDLPDNR